MIREEILVGRKIPRNYDFIWFLWSHQVWERDYVYLLIFPILQGCIYLFYLSQLAQPWAWVSQTVGEEVVYFTLCVCVCVCVCVRVHVHLCLTLCNPMDCSPPSSSVCGIFQAIILEWVATPSSRGSSWPNNRIHHLLHWQANSLSLRHLGSLCLTVHTWISMITAEPGRLGALDHSWEIRLWQNLGHSQETLSATLSGTI